MDTNPAIPVELGPAADVREALAAAGIEILEGGDLPVFNVGSVAAAVFDRAGACVCESPAFRVMQGGRHIDEDAFGRALKGAPPRPVAVELVGASGGSDTAIFVYALASHAQGWRLPPEVREAAERNPGHVAVITTQAARATGPLEEACQSYGLNGLQTRVVMETIRTGNVKAAARSVGISFHTAREALAQAMKRAHASRLPALVTRLTSLAFGVLPEADAAAVLEDLWGLTPRQAAIAALVASGASRASAAGALSIGEAVARKELERVHLVLQVSTGADLARKVAEANALRWLTAATGGDPGFVEAGAEPLQFVHRGGGGRIAVSDYGPASGAPVLVAHSNLTSRFVGRSLLRTLQAAGYRPIAIDRPGFGLTDEVAGAAPGEHDPFAVAAADTLLVLDHLKIQRLDLVARGAAQFVLALERAAPGRLRRVVLVNPAPHAAASGSRSGTIGAMKEAYLRNPALIRRVAPFFLRQGTYERLAERMRRGARGSPPDEIAVRDPDLIRDYFRAMRPFATGRIAGYVNEVTAVVSGSRPDPLPGTTEWRVLVAAHDFMHDPGKAVGYWREVLPDAQHRVVPDTGRYLTFSHPHLVVEALQGQAAEPR
jgi:pimeloyl-ACP methyl ester carboxylesterase/DNA-binding CsgD family transcriptional regulator